jgi:hypothetical protein
MIPQSKIHKYTWTFPEGNTTTLILFW